MGLSNMVLGCVPPMVICECWACLSDMVLDVFLSWSDLSDGHAILTCMVDVFLAWLDISIGRSILT